MVRSLWTAASGMIAQQNNVDTISNNLANVNTSGYKTEVAEFKSLLYQDIRSKSTSANGDVKPIPSQVGLGVRNSSITSIFTQGNFYDSTNDLAFAIDGDGFFGVMGKDGNPCYTRNGNFVLAIHGDGLALSTTDGMCVLDKDGEPIILDKDYIASKLTVTGDGQICYPDETNNPKPIGISIGVWQFNNPSGLMKAGNSLYSESAASGAAMNEYTTNGLNRSSLNQGYLEGSNVQVVDEMVNMIVAQRAYELNSKAIQASDEMMSQANQLRR